MAEVSFMLLVLKTHQIEQLRCFYQTVGIELTEERHAKGPVVNSIMLATEGEEVDPKKRREFLASDKISQKLY